MGREKEKSADTTHRISLPVSTLARTPSHTTHLAQLESTQKYQIMTSESQSPRASISFSSDANLCVRLYSLGFCNLCRHEVSWSL